MNPTLRAEWTKLRTLPGTGWLLLAAAVATVGLSAVVAASPACAASGCDDVPRLSLVGVRAGQAVIALLAIRAIGAEYDTATIATTFLAVPRRGDVLLAKAIVVSGLTSLVGAAAVVACVLVGRAALPGPPLPLTDPSMVRAGAGSVLYLVLIALLSLGIATTVRDSGVAAGVVLGLLYLVPLIARTLPDPDWRRNLLRVSPVDAGLAVQVTTRPSDLPLEPWTGLGVLAAWAAGAVVLAGLVLRARDA